jgi:hypothetical protein
VLWTHHAWTSKLYGKDLDFIYNAVLENHPGFYNKEDPDFRRNLENSYVKAKSTIKKSKLNSNLKKAISKFAKSFHDAHVWVHWFDATPQKQNHINPKFSISELSSDVVWMSLPPFDLNSGQEKEFRALIKRLLDLQTKKYMGEK